MNCDISVLADVVVAVVVSLKINKLNEKVKKNLDYNIKSIFVQRMSQMAVYRQEKIRCDASQYHFRGRYLNYYTLMLVGGD